MSEVKNAQPVDALASTESTSDAQVTTQRLASIGELLAGISHESRNLLSGILSFAQVGQSRQHDPSKMAEILKRIEEEALRCIDLHTTVLAHVSHGRPAAHPEQEAPVDVGEAILSTARLVKHHMKMKRQSLTVEPITEQLLVSFKSASLRQVLLNLLLNAMQAAPENGSVRMSASEQPGGLVCISVEDSGPGVPEPLREDIFESLFTTKEQGTGLGLAITSRLLRENDSSIEIGDSALGGARFTLTIPGPKETR